MGFLLVSIVLIVLAALFLVEHQASPTRLRDRTVLAIFLSMVIPLISMLVEHVFRNPELNLFTVPGIIVFIAGAAVRFFARRTLGQFFTYEVAVHKQHQLVTSGMYTYVRHPLYTGILLLWFGAAITLQSSTGFLLVMVMLVPALWSRMNIEEAFLIKTFGKKYQTYMRTTKRLIPFVY